MKNKPVSQSVALSSTEFMQVVREGMQKLYGVDSSTQPVLIIKQIKNPGTGHDVLIKDSGFDEEGSPIEYLFCWEDVLKPVGGK